MASQPSLGAVAAVRKEQSSVRLGDFVSVDRKAAPFITSVDGLDNLDAIVIDGVFNDSECEQLIRLTEASGYSFWNASASDEAKQFRNADTVEVLHSEFAAMFWKRLEPFVVPSLCFRAEEDLKNPKWQRDLVGTWQATGTVDLILFARYKQGGHFSPHTDGHNIQTLNRRSFYTIIAYLNDCEGGGETKFYDIDQRDSLHLDEQGRFTGDPGRVIAKVAPKKGRVLVFAHELLHEGAAVHPGCKSS